MNKNVLAAVDVALLVDVAEAPSMEVRNEDPMSLTLATEPNRLTYGVLDYLAGTPRIVQ